MKDYSTAHAAESATAMPCKFPFTYNGVTYNACTKTAITVDGFTNLVGGVLQNWCVQMTGDPGRVRKAGSGAGGFLSQPSYSSTNDDDLVLDVPTTLRIADDAAGVDHVTTMLQIGGNGALAASSRYKPTLCAGQCADPSAPAGSCSPYLTLPTLSGANGPGDIGSVADPQGCQLQWTFTNGYACRDGGYRGGDCPEQHRETNPLAGTTRCGVEEQTNIPDGACGAAGIGNELDCAAASTDDFKCVWKDAACHNAYWSSSTARVPFEFFLHFRESSHSLSLCSATIIPPSCAAGWSISRRP